MLPPIWCGRGHRVHIFGMAAARATDGLMGLAVRKEDGEELLLELPVREFVWAAEGAIGFLADSKPSTLFAELEAAYQAFKARQPTLSQSEMNAEMARSAVLPKEGQ